MAKSLLLNVLVDVLGNYVEGLTRENLKLGVWSGKVEFSNLLLKDSALDQLNLPIKVVKGSLANLRVKVPWASLESKPVEVFIDGVYLLAAPLDFSRLAAEEARKMILSSNAAKLKQVEDAILLAIRSSQHEAESSTQKASYVQQLTTRILDNLEVTVSNLHLRYEDSYADKGATFSCGVTLEQLILTTTDETWNARFVKREAVTKATTAVHKLGVIQNCAVYWNVDSPTFVKADNASWIKFMQESVFRGSDASAQTDLNYILLPPNGLRVKITHREVCSETTPNIDVQIESSQISFNIGDCQYKQLMLMAKSFAELDRKKQVSSHRPRHRPTVDPRGWWHYAFMLIVGRDRSFAAKMQSMLLCAKSRTKYIALVKQKIVSAELGDQDRKQIEEQLRGFDETLPLSALLVFREAGAKEAALEIQRHKQNQVNKQKLASGGGMFSSWFSSSKPTDSKPATSSQKSEDEEDLKLMQTLESTFNALSKQAEAAVNQAFSFRLGFASSAILLLRHSNKVFASLDLAVNYQLETRFNALFMTFEMKRLMLEDLCTPAPFSKSLLCFNDTTEAPCEITLSIKPDVMDINVFARPALITWNDACVQRLFMFVMAGNIPDELGLPANSSLRSSMASFASENSLPQSVMRMTIDLDAPKVVFPELQGSEQCVLVDMGHLIVKGSMAGIGMAWDVELNDVNIAMPLQRPDSGLTGPPQYLVKPFQVKVDVQNTKQEEADMTVNVQINPFIEADLDAMKIARLLRVIFVALSSVTIPQDAAPSKSSRVSSSTVKLIADLPQTLVMPRRRRALTAKPGPLSHGRDETTSRVNVLVGISLSKIVLVLAIESDHYASLVFQGITASVSQRPHDMQIGFRLQSLVLADSTRPSKFAEVLLARADRSSEQTDLIQGSFTSISSPASPLYTEFASEIALSVAGIHLFVDHISTATYKVLAQTLKNSFVTMKVADALASAGGGSGGGSDSETPLREELSSLGGFRFELSLEQVSVHLLAFDPSTRGLRNNLKYFEMAYSLNARSLSLAYTQQADMALDGQVRTVELVDERKQSEDHFYRKLIGGDFHRVAEDQHIDSETPMITLCLKQEPGNTMHVRVAIDQVTLQVVVGTVMHLVDVMLQNVAACMAILEVLSPTELVTEVSQKAWPSSEGPSAPASSVVVTFSMLAPQLMMLEDPKVANTKALVNRSKVYVQVVMGKSGDEDKTVVHATLLESEIFIVHDVVGFKNLHRLLQPMALEVHVSTTMVQQHLVSLDFSIGVEQCVFRTSLNDLVLISAVVSAQRLVVEPSVEDEMDSSAAAQSLLVAHSAPAKSVTVYNVASTITSFEMVLVNDYHGQNIPILKVVARDAKFVAEGVTQNLSGNGNVSIQVDYFNLPLALWEPVMEEWRPTLRVAHDFNGLEVEAIYDRSLQINVTGELLKCVVNATQLMQHIGLEEASASSGTRSALSVNNMLGIPVEVFDSSSGASLLLVSRYNEPVAFGAQSDDSSFALHADIFNLKFHGELGTCFAELKHLPNSLRHCKVLQLQPHRQLRRQELLQALPPVVESIFQYSRFNPVKIRWEAPWPQLDDPREWGDAQGKAMGDPSSIAPPEHWRWLENQWRVDKSGVVGKELDEEGWDYAVSFGSLFSGSKRRAKQPADSVRRRRWMRTRVSDAPTKVISDQALSSAFVVWDVHVNNDETKEIRVMTTKQVRNELPLEVELGIEEDKFIVHVLRIPPGTTVSIPMPFAMGNCLVRVRPLSGEADWSEAVEMTFNHAIEEAKFTSSALFCKDGSAGGGLHMLWRVRDRRFSLATLAPPLVFSNRLPCDASVAIHAVDSAGDAVCFDLPAGGDEAVMRVMWSREYSCQLAVGQYAGAFAAATILPNSDPKDVKIVLHSTLGGPAKPLVLCLRLTWSAQGSLLLLLYCECLLVDKRFLVTSDASAKSTFPNPWTDHASGLSMMDIRDGKIMLPSNDLAAVLEPIALASVNQVKSNVELMDTTHNRRHQITLQLDPFALAPDLCSVMTVMHSVHVVNCMDRPITLRQRASKGSSSYDLTVAPRSCQPWSIASNWDDTNMLLRAEGTDFSVGSVDVNSIGSTMLLLPTAPGQAKANYVAANVEIRFSHQLEPSYITVTIWDAQVVRDPSTGVFHASAAVNLLIRNDSPFSIIARQVGVGGFVNSERLSAFVDAGDRQPYGWADPDLGTQVEIFLNETEASRSRKPVAVIDSSCVGKEVTFYALGTPNQAWKVRVKAYSSGTMICIEAAGAAVVAERSPTAVGARSQDVTFKLSAHMIGVSLIAERPSRRELFSIYLADLQALLYFLVSSAGEAGSTIVEFHVSNVQIDNYCESVVYPVLLHQSKRALKKAAAEKKDARIGLSSTKSLNSKLETEDGEAPFIQFSLVTERPADQNTTIVKYVAFRMLEAQVQLDSASILIYMCDLHKDLVEVHSSLQNSEYSLVLQAQNFNSSLAVRAVQSPLYDVQRQYSLSHGNKLFYEHIVIHPIKLSVSFFPTHFPRAVAEMPAGLKWMSVVESVSAVEEMDLKIKSFIASNALESAETLATRIVNKIARDMQANLLGLAGNLIGSLSLLGKPAGLYKNIGGGVQDFFYEPYTGMMESPLSFAKGMTKGTGSLMSGVATGVVSSTANIVGSATGSVASLARGVASLAGEDKYLKERDEKKRELKSSRGGMLSGFRAGGESLVSGFSSGLSGLVTKPLEEGKKSGALGFIKGVGQGIVGVAVKPVMGVTEGISNVAMGINNQFNKAIVSEQVRPARALLKRAADDADLVLSPLDLFAARAQAYIRNRALRRNYKDEFLMAVTLGYPPKDATDKNTFGLALSAKHLAVLNRNSEPLWRFDVASLSHVTVTNPADERFCLEFFEYEPSTVPELRAVRCSSRKAAFTAYRALYRFRHCFGNPSAMASPEDTKQNLFALSQPGGGSVSAESEGGVPSPSPSPSAGPTSPVTSPRRQTSTSAAQYSFGTVNSTRLRSERGSDEELVRMAKERFLLLPVALPVTRDEDKFAYHRALDQQLWSTISDWTANHDSLLSSSRCCACLVLNYSHTPIQLREVDLKEGCNYYLFSVNDGYNPSAKVILPGGGGVVVFAFGKRPSLISKEHIKVVLRTSAFNSMVATRENRSECNPQAGFSPSFLEKTRTDWWAKFVICVT